MMYSSANQMALSRIGKSSSLVAAEGEARGRLKWFGVVRGYFTPTLHKIRRSWVAQTADSVCGSRFCTYDLLDRLALRVCSEFTSGEIISPTL